MAQFDAEAEGREYAMPAAVQEPVTQPEENGGLDAGAADESASGIEASSIINLVHRLLGVVPRERASSDSEMDAAGVRDEAARVQEEAGEQLWDMALGESPAHVMVDSSRVLDVICAVLEAEVGSQGKVGSQDPFLEPGMAISTGRPRLLECCLGILANIVCHASLSPKVAEHTLLLDLLTSQALWLAEAAPLIELCRAASVALRNPGHEHWLQRLSSKAVCLQLLWVASNTLDPQLHARALDLIVSLLHAEQCKEPEQQEQQGDHEQDGTDLQQQQPVETVQGPGGQPLGQQGCAGSVSGLGAATVALLEGGLLEVLQNVLQMAAQGKSTRTDPHLGWGRTPSASVMRNLDQGSQVTGATPGPGVAADVELTDDAVDAALRALEELVANPASLPLVVPQPGLLDALLGLLHADSSSQVIESLLLILLDLRQASVPKLSKDLNSLHKLLDALGELSASQQQLREAPVYLVALSLRQMQQSEQQQDVMASAAVDAESSALVGLAELGQRVSNLLSFPDNMTKDAVRYARAAASSAVELLSRWDADVGVAADTCSALVRKGEDQRKTEGSRIAGADAEGDSATGMSRRLGKEEKAAVEKALGSLRSALVKL